MNGLLIQLARTLACPESIRERGHRFPECFRDYPPQALNRLRAIFFVFTMSYSVYIIFSARLDRYYVGYTEDIEVRLQQHNQGISDYTSVAQDWVLLYSEKFDTRQCAKSREMEIKRKKSRKYIEWLISSAG